MIYERLAVRHRKAISKGQDGAPSHIVISQIIDMWISITCTPRRWECYDETWPVRSGWWIVNEMLFCHTCCHLIVGDDGWQFSIHDPQSNPFTIMIFWSLTVLYGAQLKKKTRITIRNMLCSVAPAEERNNKSNTTTEWSEIELNWIQMHWN